MMHLNINRLFFVFFLILIYPFLISAASEQQKNIIKDVTKNINAEVTIGSSHLTWDDGPALSIKNISIKPSKKDIVIAAKSGTLKMTKVGFGTLKIRDLKLKGILIAGIKDKKVWKVKVDSFNGDVDLSNKKIKLTLFQMNLYGGSISSKLISAEMTGKCTTTLSAKKVDVGALFKDVGLDAGGLNSMMVDKATIKINLDKSLDISGPVSLSNIALEDTGLSNSLFGLIHGKLDNGDITFDSASMVIDYHNGDIKIGDVSATSKDFDVDGALAIINGKLSGDVNTSSYGGLGGVRLMVTGTRDNPIVMPAPSTLIGGSIGGVIAGPVGVVAGAKVLGIVEDFLGGAINILTGSK